MDDTDPVSLFALVAEELERVSAVAASSADADGTPFDSRRHEVTVALVDGNGNVSHATVDESGIPRCRGDAVDLGPVRLSPDTSRAFLERVAWPPCEAGRLRLSVPEGATVVVEVVLACFHVSEALAALPPGGRLPDPLTFHETDLVLRREGTRAWARAARLEVRIDSGGSASTTRREARAGADAAAPAWATCPALVRLVEQVEAACARPRPLQKKSFDGS